MGGYVVETAFFGTVKNLWDAYNYPCIDVKRLYFSRQKLSES